MPIQSGAALRYLKSKMRNPRHAALLLKLIFGQAVTLCAIACSGIPESVRLYAADLPARADGQYALLSDDLVKKQLVMKDAELQCAIDAKDGNEATAASCKCATSAGDWLVDCKGWLGNHTPVPAAAPAPSASAVIPTPNP